MWNQIGERTGYKVEFVTASFSGLSGMLETGRVGHHLQARSPSPTSASHGTPSPSPMSMTCVPRSWSARATTPSTASWIWKARKSPINLGSNFEESAAQERPQQEDRHPHL